MSFYSDIKDFHKKFGLDYSGPPRQLDVDLGTFRTKFMCEELCEYTGVPSVDRKLIEAAIVEHVPREGLPPLVDQLDALVDLIYVALGTAYCHGFDFDEAWRRVHAKNMEKVRVKKATESLRGSTYDVVKPPGWTPADLSDLVR